MRSGFGGMNKKMICIRKKKWIGGDGIGPKYGEEVTVTGTDRHNNRLYYFLKEYPEDASGKINAYQATAFRDPIEPTNIAKIFEENAPKEPAKVEEYETVER